MPSSPSMSPTSPSYSPTSPGYSPTSPNAGPSYSPTLSHLILQVLVILLLYPPIPNFTILSPNFAIFSPDVALVLHRPSIPPLTLPLHPRIHQPHPPIHLPLHPTPPHLPRTAQRRHFIVSPLHLTVQHHPPTHQHHQTIALHLHHTPIFTILFSLFPKLTPRVKQKLLPIIAIRITKSPKCSPSSPSYSATSPSYSPTSLQKLLGHLEFSDHSNVNLYTCNTYYCPPNQFRL